MTAEGNFRQVQQWGTVRFRKERSMREGDPTTYGTHSRRRICGKVSLWFGTQANFGTRSFENTRSQRRSEWIVEDIADKSSVLCEENGIKVRSRPSCEERRKDSSFREFDGFAIWWTPNLQRTTKYKERVVLRRGNFKDEEGCRAVFTEHGVSASQMAAASSPLGHYREISWKDWRNKSRDLSVHSCKEDRSSQIATSAEGRKSWNLERHFSTTNTGKLG